MIEHRSTVSLQLTSPEMQALIGLLDVAIKNVGIRAMEDDVIGLIAAIKATAKASEMEREAA